MSDFLKDTIVHITEIAEWTPELAEEIANIQVDSAPVNYIWSIPPKQETDNEPG